MNTLENVGHQIAEVIRERGWIKGEMESEGKVCAHGAVMQCALQPGDKHIVRAVMHKKGLTEGWNDAEGRTKDEVLAALEELEVSDVAIADTFGPQWREVVALVRQATQLTAEQGEKLVTTANAAAAYAAAAYAASDDAAYAAARATAAYYAANAAAASYAAYAAYDAAYASGHAAAAAYAARAISTRHLIGTRGYTQEHYDLLMKPWLVVFPA